MEMAVEKVNQKLSLAKRQLSLPIPPPFEPAVPTVQSTSPPDRAAKKSVHLSALRKLEKRKAVESLRQKATMSVQEVALCLGVTRNTVYWWCERGIVECTRREGERGKGRMQIITAWRCG